MTQANPNKLTYPVHQVVTRTSSVTVNPTITASSAYAANNNVGGLLTFNGIAGPQQSGVIQSIHVATKSVQSAGYKLYIFNSKPIATSFSDKANTSINAADIPSLIGVYTLGSADNSLGTVTIQVLDGIGKAFVSTNPNLYAELKTTGTPTYASASDVIVTLAVMQD